MASASRSNRPSISVIIPARNEEDNLATCLESLVGQSGVSVEIIVVNDHSTDRTRAIAESFSQVRVIEAGPLPVGWTGKNNAVATGARAAQGEWLLFTDADTVHLPGSLARALKEADENHADMLSYSPEQIAVTFWEMAILPVVFAELARQYPPSKVSDPESPIAAANGQYLLVRRDAYDAVGGHAAVADDILEDVALARAVKSSGRNLRFRYAADAVCTRMYRNYAQIREGWTKNLALLFPHPRRLAFKTLTFWMLPWPLVLASVVGAFPPGRPILARSASYCLFAVGSFLSSANFGRIRRANFDLAMEWLGVFFGMPMFAYLLLRSDRMRGKGTIPWKGRTYGAPLAEKNTSSSNSKTLMKISALFILLGLISLQARAQITELPTFSSTLIMPGKSVGPLKLGDSREHALELFPRKAEDQQWDDPCGSTIDWVDTTNPMGRGDLNIRIKKGKIFQIESSTTRFQTAEGITTFDPPEKVAKVYRDMRAYVLLNPPSPALGDRPLVFWIDRRNGIVFALAFDPSHHKRYVYKVIIYEPGKEFCPELEKTNSPKWQEIHPYATEPPRELSPEP